jgi:hypothetical protein
MIPSDALPTSRNEPPLTFAYHKSLSPMLAVLLGIAMVETLVMHVVAMAIWGWRVALVLVVIDLSAVLALVQLLRSFRRLPVTLVAGTLTMRAGMLKSLAVDVKNIAGLRREWDAAAVKRRDVLNLALISWPNVIVDLKKPVGQRRKIMAIAHRFDDPASFQAAIMHLALDSTSS